VITTAANGVVGQIHARMPVMLEREGEAMWLDKSARTDDLLELLKPFSDDRMEGYAVGRSVNGRGVHGPETIAPRLAAATYSLGL
jgi:putative SOS response-associated peptidase YedK